MYLNKVLLLSCQTLFSSQHFSFMNVTTEGLFFRYVIKVSSYGKVGN